MIDGSRAKRRIDRWNRWASGEVGSHMGLRIQRIGHGVVRQLGQLFVDARDQNVVVRIGVRIGLLWILRGVHCRSLISLMSPAAGRDLRLSRQGSAPPFSPV